jgi:putative ABC transport system ATP-binding protein
MFNNKRLPQVDPRQTIIPPNGYHAPMPARLGQNGSNGSNGHGRIDPLISMRSVVKAYQTAGGEFRALRGIDLDIYPGEFLAIIGKSGAGKTTLINMLTGVDHLTEGEVFVDGVPVHQLDENRLAVWRGRAMGIIYQSFHLMPALSLLHNVVLPMDFNGLFHSRKSLERAMHLLDQVELQEHANKLPSAISGGQQQRVAFARALANDPAIIVADEPTGRLDSTTAETVFGIFLELVAQGKTIVMVTHDQSLAHRASRVIRLADGEIVKDPPAPSSQPLPQDTAAKRRGANFLRLFGRS